MFERTFDEMTGIIRIKASGTWGEIPVEDHLAQMIMLVINVRAQGMPVKVLIDVRQSGQQDARIEKAFGDIKSILYRPGDRVAIVTNTSDRRDYAPSVRNGAEFGAWQSEVAAERWLMLDATRASEPPMQGQMAR